MLILFGKIVEKYFSDKKIDVAPKAELSGNSTLKKVLPDNSN